MFAILLAVGAILLYAIPTLMVLYALGMVLWAALRLVAAPFLWLFRRRRKTVPAPSPLGTAPN